MNKIYYKDIPYKVGGDSTLVEATITERGETSASDFRADGFSKVNVNVPYTDVHYAKDDIVSFEGEDFPLKSLTADITALQDLHGYYYPWVGGSGKNLFNMGSKWSGSASGLSFTTDDDYVTMNGVKSGANYVTPLQLYFDLPAGTYYAKAFVISGTASNEPSIYVYSNQELTSNMLNTGRSFTLESQTSVGIRFAFWNDGATYSNYKIGIVISKDADIDKFYPYSNECPISGWSAVDVSVSGVNVWDEVTESGIYNISTGQPKSEGSSIRGKNSIIVKPNTTYYANNQYLRVLFYDKNDNYLNLYKVGSGEFTTPNNCYIMRMYLADTYGTTYNNDISINYPSTDTEYHAYNGNTYSLTFTDGSNPLTVYGGTVDLVSGVLTVDRVMFALNGSEKWTTDIVGDNKRRFTCTSLIDLGVTTSTTFDAISNIYVNTKNASYTDLSEVFILRYLSKYNQNRIDIMTEAYQDVASFKAFLNSTNMQIVYELATPLTYQLSKQQIKSLVGVNNIFADTGEVAVEWQTLYQTP